ncbi:MAG TPA: Gfo/Idh/MocA family oxidoreductase [Gemmatimonadaceae bacterium]|jgi:predicted dehydrogenase|nr:Gfo/Idh/MocA family oxidoreductase [Gemmatimonadaceae bacterium]
MSSSDITRRDLLKGAALAGAAVVASGKFSPAIAENVDAIAHPDAAPPAPFARKTMRGVPFERHETVRIGMVGTGLRGRSVLNELLGLENVQIVAICDVVPDKMAKATKMITDAGHPAPETYSGDDHAFEKLVKRDDIDFVYTATPWEFHVPVMLAALNAGKHCGSECPIGTTLKDLWALVDASEKAGRHCLHLENCCYGETEMLINRMVHDGVFGDVLHAEAAYLHDLREILFENRDEGLWRRAWHTRANANLYPTHGLGPVAWYLDIHHGDRFDYIASVAGPERGLDVYREATVKDKADPKWQEKYITGDHNTSIIRTVKGKTIMLQHDVSNPRPYTRHNRIQGTKGAFEDYPPRVYVEGQAGGESWKPVESWKATHTHPLWAKLGEKAKNGGHGGMDFVMAYRLIECLHEGLVPDYDVYDAAAWSAPFPLTEMSVAKGSAPMKFPDFTRGEWDRARV